MVRPALGNPIEQWYRRGPIGRESAVDFDTARELQRVIAKLLANFGHQLLVCIARLKRPDEGFSKIGYKRGSRRVIVEIGRFQRCSRHADNHLPLEKREGQVRQVVERARRLTIGQLQKLE